MIIFKLLTYLAGAITLGMFGYLYTVLDDAGMLDEIARIPADDIMLYHIVAAVVIVWLIFGLVMKVVSRGIIIVLLLLAVGAEGTFIGLNLSGKIVEQSEMLEQLEDAKDELMDKAKGLLDN